MTQVLSDKEAIDILVGIIIALAIISFTFIELTVYYVVKNKEYKNDIKKLKGVNSGKL